MSNFGEFAGLSETVSGPANHEAKGDIVASKVKKSAKKRLPALDWIGLYALAVNEENAGGGRVVTNLGLTCDPPLGLVVIPWYITISLILKHREKCFSSRQSNSLCSAGSQFK